LLHLSLGGVFSATVDFKQTLRDFEFDQNYGGFLHLRQWTANSIEENETFVRPDSAIFKPVYQALGDPTSKVVGFLMGVVEWDIYLLGLLPDGVEGIYCVLKNTCGEEFTYKLRGTKASNGA
jgi:hypothetical protein